MPQGARRNGKPRSEAERKSRHKRLTGSSKTPHFFNIETRKRKPLRYSKKRERSIQHGRIIPILIARCIQKFKEQKERQRNVKSVESIKKIKCTTGQT